MNILWDFDGTLMNTYPAYAKLVKGAVETPLTEMEIYDLLKVTFGHAFREMGLSKEQVAHIRALERQLHPSDFAPFPSVEKVLAAAEINVIMTHKYREGAESILKFHGLDGYFTEIVSMDDGFPLKPDPASYRYLHEKYHIDLVVGDRELDVLPAQMLGIQTCLFQNHGAQADYYVDHYDDFFDIVNGMQN